MANDMTIATEIRDQLGGAALAMMGATNVLGDERALQMKIRGSRTVTNLRIELADDDTYTVSFFKIRGYDVRTVGELAGVYADQLRTVIEKQTGLYLSL